MAKYLNDVVGTMEYDGLIIDHQPVADVVTITLAAAQGVVTRGSVVTGTAGGSLSVAKAALSASNATYIVADDVDTTGGTVTVSAYRCGHFSRSKLKANGYTLVAADFEILRNAGILVGDSI